MAIAVSPASLVAPFNHPSGQPLSRRENEPAVVRRPPRPEPAAFRERPKPKAAHEDEGISGDKQVDAYVYALAAMIEESGGDSAKFMERIKDLMHLGAQSAEAGSGEAVMTAAEVQAYEGVSVSYSQSESGFSFYGSYAASLSGRFRQEVVAEDGTSQILDISFEVKVEVEIAVSTSQENMTDPLALDLDGDEQISLAQDFSFDIDGDGKQDLVPFAAGSDAFLALDRNGDGTINDGSELFGDHHGALNGFEELRRWDEDGNGLIDGNDGIFGRLKGVSAGKEGALAVYSLAQLSVQSISLNYTNLQREGEAGSVVSQQGSYTGSGGEMKAAYDLLLPRKEVVA